MAVKTWKLDRYVKVEGSPSKAQTSSMQKWRIQMSSFFGARYGSNFILAFRFCNLDANFAKTLKRLRNNVSIAGKSKSMTNTSISRVKQTQQIENDSKFTLIRALFSDKNSWSHQQKFNISAKIQIDTEETNRYCMTEQSGLASANAKFDSKLDFFTI